MADNQTQTWLGRSVERVEDAALLTGRGRFGDDLPVRQDCLHAAFLRSPYAHAEIGEIDASAALAMPGVVAVVTGADIATHCKPFVVGVKQPMQHYPMAVERARYVGEPVAIVIARDRYVAEDALAAIVVDYRPLPAAATIDAAMAAGAPVLHDAVGGNVVSDRVFSYGDPDAAFASADHVVELSIRYPRNSCTPIECYVAVAEYDAAAGTYDVLANFQGPFALHPVMAMALKVPANRLRLRTPPDSGGSFGVKQGVFPYIVALSVAARLAGRPVKWVEDRLEHLTAANAATGRATTIKAAVQGDGTVTALDLDQIDDCGAYLRAPEPATLYRMHGNLSGAYKIPNVRARNRVVLTNTLPSGLNRGFGGPQLYYAIERLMHKIALTLGRDPLEIIQRNLVSADQFPYTTPSGARFDSGDYGAALERAVADGGLAALQARRDQVRAAGGLYGIGYAAVVEPTVSNMGYITTVLSADERARAGPKDGAQAAATVALDPLGGVSVTVDSVPQGQGHRTVIAQTVADAFGLDPAAITVNATMDTAKDAWSIAAGNYACRFAPAVAGAAHIAAMRLRDRLAGIAAGRLNVAPSDVVFANGAVSAAGNPDNAFPFARIAGLSHWSPGSLGADPVLRETEFWTSEVLTPPTPDDRINSSAAYGFIFDFCGVEVDPDTGRVRIDKYVTMHDAGRRLHPAMVDGQIRGGFAHAVGAALFEAFVYDDDGNPQTGTFADYPPPTACEIPDPVILHFDTPSPVTPLGAKGVGEGNSMSTPVCIANAVADALGREDISLPLTPARVADMIHGPERERGS